MLFVRRNHHGVGHLVWACIVVAEFCWVRLEESKTLNAILTVCISIYAVWSNKCHCLITIAPEEIFSLLSCRLFRFNGWSFNSCQKDVRGNIIKIAITPFLNVAVLARRVALCRRKRTRKAKLLFASVKKSVKSETMVAPNAMITWSIWFEN